jgi:LacI family transcriptional regulator
MYGLAIPDFSNAIYAQIITGAEKQAALIGKHLLTSSLVDFTSESFLEVLGPGRIDGLLIAGTIGAIDTSLDATGVPWLYLNRRSPGRHRHVLLDDQGAGYLATNHLLALGHRHIAHVAGPPSADTALRRHSGYVAALRDAGLSSAAHIVVADYTEAGGARAIGQILQESRQVSAVIVANVASAIGVLSGAHRAGVRVPDQLSVIAIQDLPTAGYLVPPLTTVRMPLEELGRRGVELLARLSAWAIVDETLSAPMEINVRASTAPPPVAAA